MLFLLSLAVETQTMSSNDYINKWSWPFSVYFKMITFIFITHQSSNWLVFLFFTCISQMHNQILKLMLTTRKITVIRLFPNIMSKPRCIKLQSTSIQNSNTNLAALFVLPFSDSWEFTWSCLSWGANHIYFCITRIITDTRYYIKGSCTCKYEVSVLFWWQFLQF